MTRGWETKRLGDVLTLQRGFDLPERMRKPGSIPIVSSSGVTGFHDSAKVQPPGVVTGRYGTLGEVFYLREAFWPLNTALFVADFHDNDPRWCAYLLQTMSIGTRTGAAAVPGVNRNHLHALPVTVPTRRSDQRRIADILGAYDDLIENNTRRIRVLEEMARALYREWIEEQRAPMPMVEWEAASVSSVVDLNPRNRFDREDNRPFVTMSGISADSMVVTETERRLTRSGSSFRNGDTLFARITPCLENGKTAFVQCFDDGEVASGSTEFIVMRERVWTPEMVYLLARTPALREHARQSMSGATGRQRVNERCFDSYFVRVPPREVRDLFTSLVRPMFALVQRLHDQSRNLRTTRDLLLPRLISGELDVRAAEREAP